MPVKLDTLPGPSIRPIPPKPLRWLGALFSFIAAGILLMRFLGKLVDETSFWWLAIGIPMVFWFMLIGFRLVVYMMQQIQANAWDRRRQQVILQETRRGRRALNILAAECYTANAADVQFAQIINVLMQNENKIFPQTSWDGGSNIRHSRLPVSGGISLDAQILVVFSNLLKKMSGSFSLLAPDNPIAILLESSSSLSDAQVRELWQQTWLESEFPQPTLFIAGHGLAAIDHWLDHRIKDKAVLLVIALQIAPEQPEMTGEAVVGLLLGNRLTQKTLTPMALLHRPESSHPQPETLQEKIVQAVDWVPLPPNALQHLWLAGLSGISEGYRCAVVAQSKQPLAAIDPQFGIHNFNEFLGDPGRAAPWLAIAAATQAISQSPAPHMIINGEQGSDTVWSTVVSPYAFHKENNA